MAQQECRKVNGQMGKNVGRGKRVAPTAQGEAPPGLKSITRQLPAPLRPPAPATAKDLPSTVQPACRPAPVGDSSAKAPQCRCVTACSPISSTPAGHRVQHPFEGNFARHPQGTLWDATMRNDLVHILHTSSSRCAMTARVCEAPLDRPWDRRAHVMHTTATVCNATTPRLNPPRGQRPAAPAQPLASTKPARRQSVGSSASDRSGHAARPASAARPGSEASSGRSGARCSSASPDGPAAPKLSAAARPPRRSHVSTCANVSGLHVA